MQDDTEEISLAVTAALLQFGEKYDTEESRSQYAADVLNSLLLAASGPICGMLEMAGMTEDEASKNAHRISRDALNAILDEVET